MRSPVFRYRSTWTTIGAAVLGGALWFGCADAPRTPVEPDAELNRAGRAVDVLQELDLTPALQAQERHGAALLRVPGVVGHGVGVGEDGDPTITVFTLKPGVSGIPARLDDVPTRTVVSGQFVAGELTARLRPAPNGYSVGHPDITAGTLGAVVQDGGGACYVLSNNHVLANSNDANIGDSALQPGAFDGGSDPADAIGTLADFQPIAFDGSTNTMDAAIAEVFTPVADFVKAETPHFIPTSNPVGASVKQDVKKTGRTTELTTGEVTEVNVSVNVCYECAGRFCFNCKKFAHFENQFATTDMSDGGDSGSLIVDTGDNPVGLLFAGSDTRTIANPIGDVLTRFGATVIQPADLGSCTNGGTTVDSPPSVTITNPSGGATVSGSVAVTADASDDDGVSQVEFFVDGGSIGVDTDGSNGWSAAWDTKTAADGSHTVSAEATDTGSQTASDAVTVTVDNSGSSGFSMHVGDLDGSKNVKGKSGKWEAFVTVTVHDGSHGPVTDASVNVSWTGAVSGSGSGVTGSDGTVTLGTGNIDGTGSVTFTVETVSSSSFSYDEGANHDPDQDSDGVSIVVEHP